MTGRLLYGRNITGELSHISEVLAGDACGCVCPHCEMPLTAKKGRTKVHHFVHLGKNCAFRSVYDFLHVEERLDAALSLAQWVNWKQEAIYQQTQQRQTEYTEYEQDMAELMLDLTEARNNLVAISNPSPSQKQRSKQRQANYEVLQQWDAYLTDSTAPIPAFERVRDLEPCLYATLRHQAPWYGGRKQWFVHKTAWSNQLGRKANKRKTGSPERWLPNWLANGLVSLLNEYWPLRREVTTQKQHWERFRLEKAWFDCFRFYVLRVDFTGRGPLYRTGITSRPDLAACIRETQTDLEPFGVVQINPLIELAGQGFLDSYFKRRYVSRQLKLGPLVTPLFDFDETQSNQLRQEVLNLVAPPPLQEAGNGNRIKAGMAQARRDGVHVGRPKGNEADERFLAKPRSQQVVALLAAYPDWSMREIARHSGIAINTVCKVGKLIGASGQSSVEAVEKLASPMGSNTEELDAALPATTASLNLIDEDQERRQRVLEELQRAEEYMVILVQKPTESGIKPISMHISKLNAIGPALSTLAMQDEAFCEALADIVEQARRHRNDRLRDLLAPAPAKKKRKW